MNIKFITLNIWQGKLLDNAVAFVKRESPDILVLQEVYGAVDIQLSEPLRTYDVIREKCDYSYAAYAPAFKHLRDEGAIVQGNAIFSRFPILETNITFYDVPYSDRYEDIPSQYEYAPRNLQQAVIDATGTRLNIFNTHGIWGTHGEDTERRIAMCDTIVEHIKDKERVLLAGDFNFFRHTQGISRIEKYLQNIFGDELATSFNIKHKTTGDYSRSVVDMMFSSQDIKIKEHYCPQVDVSDHLPLVGVFESM